jgi:uncharacterized protein
VIPYHLGGLLGEPVGSVRDHVFEVVPKPGSTGDLRTSGPVAGGVRFLRTNRGILVTGAAHAELVETCDRCLDEYLEPITVALNEELLPSIDLASGAAVHHVAEDAEIRRIDSHHEIDLWPVIAEELVLTEPAHHLCRPDCPGLCPVCGRHRDREPCGHQTDEVDPRLAPLAELLRRPPE